MPLVALSNESFGSIPKSYVRTSIDKVTTPALQDRMIANWKVESVHDLESGHFPAFSVPKQLADLMIQTVPVLSN